MKKIAKILCLEIVIVLLAISCSIESFVEDRLTENVYSDIQNSQETVYYDIQNSSKSVDIRIDSTLSDISYFKYRFTPTWSNDESIVGNTNGWKTDTRFPTEWNVYFEQGQWNIEVEMYDSSNNKVGDAFSETIYINRQNNSIMSNLAEWLSKNGTGKINFNDIIIPKLYSLPSHYEMTAGGNSTKVINYYVHWSLLKIDGTESYSGDLDYVKYENGISYFGNTTVSNINVGEYILSLTIKENKDSSTSYSSGGETCKILIYRNCTSIVDARINTSDYILSSFRAFQNETGYTGKIKATYTNGSKTATLELIADNATNVKWYQNGEYKSSYGNGTVANVSNIKSGSASLGLYGTCSNYFDCIFTNSVTGLTSSCSYVLVAGGQYGGSSDDSSVLTLETGNEIVKWNYSAVPLSGVGETVYGAGSGTTDKSIYLDEGKWKIQASALNNKGLEISSGLFVGYINKNDNTIDVPLDSVDGYGWLNINEITSSRNYESGTVSNQTISWKVTNLSTGEIVTSGSSSTSTKVSNYKWKFNPNDTKQLMNGSYRVDITTTCKHTGTVFSIGNGTFNGTCSVIVNIHAGVTTIVQGTLTTNYKVS